LRPPSRRRRKEEAVVEVVVGVEEEEEVEVLVGSQGKQERLGRVMALSRTLPLLLLGEPGSTSSTHTSSWTMSRCACRDIHTPTS
jgi:ABC-type taurine transport system ATPase subunit